MINSELYESDKIFKELMDHISNGVAIYETNDNGETFIIREMNNVGLRICESTREDIIGKNLSEVFPRVGDFGFLNALRNVWKTGKPEHSPTAFYQDDKVDGWTKLYIYKLSSGKVVAIFDRQTELFEAQEIINRKKIEDELQKSENEKSVILESLLEHIIYQAPDNTIIWANKAAADSVNMSPQDLIGRRCYEVWNELKEPCKDCPVVKSLKSKKPETNEMKTPDGRVWRVAGYPVKDKDDNIIGLVESTLDITEKTIAEAKLRESERQYRTTIDSLGDPLHVVDKDLNIILINKELENWLDQLQIKTEMLGKKISDVFPFLPKEVYEEYDQVFKNGITLISTEETTLSGREIITETRKIPIFHERAVEQILTIIRDITERTEMENQLIESEEKYRKAYNQANLYRDIFAHDINNMLQNIQSSAELSALYLNNPEKLHTLKELFDIITEQIERGKKLINNVRKITKIDESEINLEKIEATTLLIKAINYLKSSFQARIMNIQIEPSNNKFYVMANNLLLDVFENILINAVRHNRKSTIEINVDITKEHLKSVDYIKMEFKDNAIGISNYRKKSIFEKGKPKSQNSKGMGLGLSLVKKIIDSYNGDIWVEDRIKGDHEQGSNFVVLLREAK